MNFTVTFLIIVEEFFCRSDHGPLRDRGRHAPRKPSNAGIKCIVVVGYRYFILGVDFVGDLSPLEK